MESKSVGIWIRASTEDQARGESPEHHEQRAKYYAESKGWNIKVFLHDDRGHGPMEERRNRFQNKCLGHDQGKTW